MPTPEQIKEVLKGVVDPEIMIDIVNLGMVYDIQVDEEANTVSVDMTLTSPGCPMGPQILTDAHQTIMRSYPDLEDANINLVWVPFWNSDMMTDFAKEELGFF